MRSPFLVGLRGVHGSDPSPAGDAGPPGERDRATLVFPQSETAATAVAESCVERTSGCVLVAHHLDERFPLEIEHPSLEERTIRDRRHSSVARGEPGRPHGRERVDALRKRGPGCAGRRAGPTLGEPRDPRCVRSHARQLGMVRDEMIGERIDRIIVERVGEHHVVGRRSDRGADRFAVVFHDPAERLRVGAGPVQRGLHDAEDEVVGSRILLDDRRGKLGERRHVCNTRYSHRAMLPMYSRATGLYYRETRLLVLRGMTRQERDETFRRAG